MKIFNQNPNGHDTQSMINFFIKPLEVALKAEPPHLEPYQQSFVQSSIEEIEQEKHPSTLDKLLNAQEEHYHLGSGFPYHCDQAMHLFASSLIGMANTSILAVKSAYYLLTTFAAKDQSKKNVSIQTLQTVARYTFKAAMRAFSEFA